MGFRLYFKRFRNSQKDSKLGFVDVAVVGLFQFVKEMEYWDF